MRKMTAIAMVTLGIATSVANAAVTADEAAKLKAQLEGAGAKVDVK